MKYNSHDLKLSAFFTAHQLREDRKMSKTASDLNKTASTFDNFVGITSPEEERTNAKMVHQMLELGKYQPIISALKNAHGIVNFVTNNEFGPLVELLVKRVFNPSSNDLYGASADSPTSYGLNAKDYFGDAPLGDQGANKYAQRKLDELINGEPLMMDAAWRQRMGLDDTQMGNLLGGEAQFNQWAQWVNMTTQIAEYQKQIGNIQRTLARERDVGHQRGTEEKLTVETRLRDLKAVKQKMQKSANTIAEKLKLYLTDENDRVLRHENGFKHFNPLAEINKIGGELSYLQENNKPVDKMRPLIMRFVEKLLEYPTTDQSLIAKRRALVDFFGPVSSPEELNTALGNFRTGYKVFGRLFSDFVSRAKQHGKVLILHNFENSAFCTPAGTPGQPNSYQTDQGILSGFNDFNDANHVKDGAAGNEAAARSNRVILIVSTHQILGLPQATVVEMNMAPVDIPEAEIIVDNLTEQVAASCRKVFTINEEANLVEKYPKSEDGTREAPKVMQYIKSRCPMVGRVDETTLERMKHWICGMGQKQAVQAIRFSLQNGIVTKPNPANPSGPALTVDVDAKAVFETLKERVNQAHQQGVDALQTQDPTVKFEEYAYKKISKWANRVKSVGMLAKSLANERANILQCRKDLLTTQARIDANPGMSISEKNGLVRYQELKRSSIEKSRTAIRRIAAGMPHLYILYGDPGVGKSVWADALASLLNYVIKNVDIGAARTGLVGGTEELTRKLMKSMLGTQDTVFLIDEIDRQLGQSSGSEGPGSAGSGQAPHETSKYQVKEFLDTFELPENINKFFENNIFVIMTTNFVGDCDKAMKARVKDRYLVELPDDLEAYLMMVDSYMQVEHRRAPHRPIYCEEGETDDEKCWQQTFAMIKKINWPAIAQTLTTKRISFREVKQLLTHAFAEDLNWRISVRELGKGARKADGKPIDLLGLPLTTENMMAAIGHIDEANKDYNDDNLGVPALMVQRQVELEALMKDRKLKEVTTEEEYLETEGDDAGKLKKKKVTGFAVDEDIVKLMSGQAEQPAVPQDPDFAPKGEEYIDPNTGKPRKRVNQLEERTPAQKMKDMVTDSFKERSLIPPAAAPAGTPVEGQPAEKQETMKETPAQKKKEKDKETTTSSTDYYFNLLLSQGIVDGKGEIVKQAKGAKKTKDPAAQMGELVDDPVVAEGSGFTPGVYNFGSWIIAPATENTPIMKLDKSRES